MTISATTADRVGLTEAKTAGAVQALRDVALLLARIGLGVVLIAHGRAKLDSGIAGVTAGFEGMGIPAAGAAAVFATAVELGGGVLLILGALTPLAGVLVALNMLGAWWFAHRDAGVLVSEGGYELVLVIGLLGLLLAAVGAGRISIDGFIGRGRKLTS